MLTGITSLSTNYTPITLLLYNRAFIKLNINMVKFEKALSDIETAIEVNNDYDNIWYLSLKAY